MLAYNKSRCKTEAIKLDRMKKHLERFSPDSFQRSSVILCEKQKKI